MAAQTQRWLTPEQYLEIERVAEFRSEYYNGRMYAMAGGSYRHARFAHNLSRRLGNALDGSPSEVSGPDPLVRVAPNGLHTYADLVNG